MRSRRGQAGFSLIELMVSMAVAALAVGFIFRIYATSSVAYRTQSQIAELQQSLRTAKQAISSQLRKAGYFASNINTGADTGLGGSLPPSMSLECEGKIPNTTQGGAAAAYSMAPVRIINSSTGPDEIHIVYADTNCIAQVSATGPDFHAAVTEVVDEDQLSCFADGDVVVAVRTADGACGSKRGWGCTLMVTHLTTGPNPKIGHNPGQGDPYNMPGNGQCEHLAADWADGHTAFMKFRAEGYRIKPGDPRGVLQYSASAGAVDDWQDLAFGFVDMQFALQVYQVGDGTDSDGDGSAEYDWYSGEDMETISLAGGAEFMQVRMSLVARTVAEVEGPGTLRTPSLTDEANPDNNPIGDRASVLISDYQDDTTSPYYGNHSYRMVSTIIDLRNLGIGRVQ